MKSGNLQKWFLIIAMWAVIIALIFAFYWIQVRPVKIRRICAQKATKVSAGLKSKSTLPEILELHQAIYSECLRSNGIER